MSEDADRLFVALREEPPLLREQRLRALCDNPQVRQQVLELLSADQAASEQHWLEAAPVKLASAWIGSEETETDAADSSQPDQVGPSLRRRMPSRIGRYEVRDYLGGGGFAEVYRAYDPHLDIDVAVKVSRRSVDGERERERFLREAQHVIKLNHPHIVRVYNADVTSDGQAYIVMEHVDGLTLREYIARHPRLSLDEVARILRPVCDAMACAHQANLVHRDLKPANILIGPEGTPKVTDFGLAVRDDSPHARGEYAGTTAYMAPEQVRGETDDLHGSTDIWALGVILYELLGGRRPFEGSREQIHDEILTKTPKRLREIRDEIPAEVEALCARCLAKEPADRPGSARDIAREMKRAGTRRRPAKALMLVLGFVVAALAIVARKMEPLHDRYLTTTGLDPMQWYDVPLQNPRWLLTGIDEQSTEQRYHRDRQELYIDTGGLGLFGLGAIDNDDVVIQATIQRNAWSGLTGVFLGFHEAGDGTQSFQAFSALTNGGADETESYLCRDLYVFDGGNQRITPLAAGRINSPGIADIVLEIEVRNGRVTKVRWDGTPVIELLDSPSQDRPDSPRARGQFGIFNMRGATRVRSVRIMSLEKATT